MQLDGRTAIVTGATGGIGAAVARRLDAAGMRLVLTAREPEKLASLAAGLTAAKTLPGEMTDPALPQRLADLAETAFGGADVLINNAGSMVIGSIDEIDLDAACAMIRLNFEAAVRMAYTALRSMKARGSGYLINTSSIAGLKVTDPRFAVYTGTKMALEGFTESLRLELAGTGIAVGCIEPGGVDTGLYSDWTGDAKRFVEQMEMLAPDDVARAVLFMLEQPAHVRVPKLFITHASQPI